MSLDDEALRYHSEGRPGKIEVVPTKSVATQRELSLAYSQGSQRLAASSPKILGGSVSSLHVET